MKIFKIRIVTDSEQTDRFKILGVEKVVVIE